MAEGQMEAQSDGAAAVSVVTGLPAATQTGTPAVTRVTGSDPGHLLLLYGYHIVTV